VQSLDELDLTRQLSKRDGKRQLKAAQTRLRALRLQTIATYKRLVALHLRARPLIAALWR
jgi:hypothetical protein